MSRGIAWIELSNGVPVSFHLGHNEKGPCAIDVTLVDEIPTKEGNTTRRVGRVVEYYSDRAYVFLQCPDGSRFFLHKSNMVQAFEWPNIRNGVFVTFKLGRNEAGVCATDVSILSDDSSGGGTKSSS